MAKKKLVRRVPQSPSPRMYGDGKPSQAAQAATGKSPAARATSGGMGGASIARGAANLAQEYGYVLGDLKRLGLIAGALFAVLVILGVVIR